MSAKRSPNMRLRIILDCTLVILFFLTVSASYLSAQARIEARSSARGTLVSDPVPMTNKGLESLQPVPAFPELDNSTLAAMIAAENAALIPPVHFTDLPLVTR